MFARWFILIAFACLLAWPDAARADKKWRTKENCTLIENESNDGDSFHIRVAKRHYIFRLLWVDTPETEQRYPERVAEQAAYFGITPEQATRVGKEAVKFSANFLKEPFTVYTQFDDAMGASNKDRDYAVIKVGDTYLMEALVSNGLARIFGLQELPEDGPSISTMRLRLKGLEADAKKNRRGAWAYAQESNTMPGMASITEQALTVQRTTAVFATDNSARLMGNLTPGMSITVLRAETPILVRVRFTLSDGRAIEGLCRRAELGL